MNKDKPHWRDCAIRDIKDYADGCINKEKLAQYLEEDLEMCCMTWWGFARTIFFCSLISHFILKWITR